MTQTSSITESTLEQLFPEEFGRDFDVDSESQCFDYNSKIFKSRR